MAPNTEPETKGQVHSQHRRKEDTKKKCSVLSFSRNKGKKKKGHCCICKSSKTEAVDNEMKETQKQGNTFHLCLSEDSKDRLARVNLPLSFEAMVEPAFKVNNQLSARSIMSEAAAQCCRWQHNNASSAQSTSQLSSPGPTPLVSQEVSMQLGWIHLTLEEQQ